MNDSSESSAQGGTRTWLFLIHQLPPKPDYVRVKVRRRLQRLGAAALKSSVYALPDTEEHLEDFQWLANEIVADGGDATIVSGSLLSGVTDEELEAGLSNHVVVTKTTGDDRVDRGSTWVTRQGVFIDRMASAWLIRRFIDPGARFKFVPARGYRPLPDELRFDMYQGEYSHVGDRCTFETLLDAFGLDDPALVQIGEIVHDIDCKDAKFGRREAAGILAVIQGIALATTDDEERIARGSPIFDGLYGQLSR